MEVVGSDASPEDYLRIASHFQKTGDHLQAGQFFLKAKDYAKVRRVGIHSLKKIE